MPLRRRVHLACLVPCSLLLLAGTQGMAEPARNPAGGGGSTTLERVPDQRPPAASSRTRRVYACTSAGHVEFSDRPCGPASQVRELDVAPAALPAPGRGAQATSQPAAARAGSGPDSASGSRSSRQDEGADESADAATALAARESLCRRLGEAVRDLDERLRTGYSAREAGRLWARWREARERLREARC